MKRKSISLVLVMFISACGSYGTPLPEELAGDEASSLFAVKEDKADKEAQKDQDKADKEAQKDQDKADKEAQKALDKAVKEAQKGKKGKKDRNGRCIMSDDPLADLMPFNKLKQDFEKEPLGELAQVHHWIDATGATATVTDEQAFGGKKSLKLTTAAGKTAQSSGVKFCVACEVMERFKVSFAIRFENFISWNGLMVTNNPHLAYWWWVRSNGTVFDEPASTAANLKAKTWHKVEIDIDRKAGEAHLTVDGSEYVVPLQGTWYDGAHDQPMGCFRVATLAPAKASQTIYVDSIKVHAVK